MVDGGVPQAQLRPLAPWRSPRTEALAAEDWREPGSRSSSCWWAGRAPSPKGTSGSLGATRGRRWLGWRHGGVAEFLQDVAGPPADLAGHRQAGPVVVDAVPDAAVVGMVRGALGEREKPWEAPVPRPGARLNAS